MTQSSTSGRLPAFHHQAARRLFLRQTGALSLAAGTGAPLALQLLATGSAAAQTAADYKAIVCLFMFGGNDAFNTVLPTDPASWAHYLAMRPESSVGLLQAGVPPNPGAALGSSARQGGVLPLTSVGAATSRHALHPQLQRLQALYNTERRLAVVANIGPLQERTTKRAYIDRTVALPPRLFSHNDQQSVWQTMQAEGATVGWGGRLADRIAAYNQPQAAFAAVSAAGNAAWLSGDSVRQYQVGGLGAQRLGADAGGRVYDSSTVASALQRIATTPQGNHALERDIAAVSRRSIDAEAQLRGALAPPDDGRFGTAPAGGVYQPANDPRLRYLQPASGTAQFNPLALQLQVVARLIDAGRRGQIGVRRQVFFVSLGGFDTHNNQRQTHTDLMARLDHALGCFDTMLGAIGAREAVTTFTASDFGRTFTSNGDGTDHGWGGHQFVMGGAVRGGRLYGSWPTLVARNPQTGEFDSSDQVRNGALLPSTSVEQLGATLGRWFGAGESDLQAVFPRLQSLQHAGENLAFLG